MDEARLKTQIAARCVSARELARQTGALIDEVVQDGKVFAVSRFGKMVALIVPLPDRVVLEFDDRPTLPIFDELQPKDEEPIDLAALDLSEGERDLLVYAAADPAWSPNQYARKWGNVGQAAANMTRLELKDLLERTYSGGLRITALGRRVAELLG